MVWPLEGVSLRTVTLEASLSSAHGVSVEALSVRASPMQDAAQQLFTRVWAWLGASLLLSGCAVLLVSGSTSLRHALLVHSWLGAAAILLQLAFALGITELLPRCSAGVCRVLMVVYAALDGFTLNAVFSQQGPSTIAAAMFVASATFALTAAWAAATGRNPSSPRLLGGMALGGLALSALVALWMRDSVTTFAMCAGAVAVFLALAASDTPRLRAELLVGTDVTDQRRGGPAGALMVHLDFVTLFMKLFRQFRPHKEPAVGKA